MTHLWSRLKGVVVHQIVGVDDTPHRIAFGVFLGFLVAWTPTLGVQIVIYVALATLLRANKVSGIPILFISNPVSAAPFYYFTWWVGSLLLRQDPSAAEGQEMVSSRLDQAAGLSLADLFTFQFWEALGQLLWQMGAELWLGSVILGGAAGLLGYAATLQGIRAYRRVRGRP